MGEKLLLRPWPGLGSTGPGQGDGESWGLPVSAREKQRDHLVETAADVPSSPRAFWRRSVGGTRNALVPLSSERVCNPQKFGYVLVAETLPRHLTCFPGRGLARRVT